jgi:hypothetical protein
LDEKGDKNMIPMMPMMYMPLMGNLSPQPTAEQMAQMQRLALQNQQMQLKQMKQMLEQYAQAIDAALEQVEGQFAKLEKGETATVLPQAQVQAQAQGIPQAQVANVITRLRFSDMLISLGSDPQGWVAGGMGEFGRPVF